MDLNTEQINNLLDTLKNISQYSQELVIRVTNSVLIFHITVSIVTIYVLVFILYTARLTYKHLKRTEDKLFYYFIMSMCVSMCVVLISSSIISIFKCVVSP